jgi:hypothetical protein
MKRIILICLFLLLIPLTAQAQKTLQSAATATGTGNTLTISPGVTPTNGVTAQITGTFSGTVTWRATLDNVNYVDVIGTNLTDGTQSTTATAPGLYSFILPRVVGFRGAITTYSSGSITVTAAAASGVARLYTEGSGGGVSQVTGVNTNGFTFSIANPTTTPAITLTMQNSAADGSTKGVAGFLAADFDASSGIISIDYTNAQKATSSVPGFLSAADWSAFNGKQAALGFTAENVANKDTDGTLAANSDTKYASQKATKTYADTKEVPLTFSSPLVRTTNNVACTTCVIASSPGAGIAHFAGSTQTVTSSAIVNADITNSTIDLTAKVAGLLPAANIGVNVLDQSVYYAADAGSNDTYVITLSPVPAGYVTGGHYRFKANTANTGAATININSLGAKTIKKAAGGITTDLADNDILSGQFVDLVYDGTNMQMQSTLGNAAGGGGTTINSTNSVIPQRSNSSTFIDSPVTGSVPGSMVDGITVTGAATANPAFVQMSATGSDSNINVAIINKGTNTGLAIGGTSSSFPMFVPLANGNLRLVNANFSSGKDLYVNGLYSPNDTTPIAAIQNGTFSLVSTGTLQYSNGSSIASATFDVGIGRSAPKVLRIGDSGANANGWLQWSGQARLTADATNSTATFSNLTDLTISNLQAGRKYTGRMTIKCINSTATEGIQFDFNGGSATMTSFFAAAGVLASGGTDVIGTSISTSLAGVINFTTFTGESVVVFDISFVVNGAGTLIPRFAENSTAVGTATARLGSFVILNDSPN